MKNFSVETRGNVKIDFNFPTSIDEIDSNYLLDATKYIRVADNYTLVALCYREKLSRVILAARSKKKDTKMSIVPLFVKAGATDSEFIKAAKTKDTIICMPTQLQLGTHVRINQVKLNLDFFIDVVNSTIDSEIYNNELRNDDQSPCTFFEFKLLPNSDVLGIINNDGDKVSIDKYVTITRG